MRYFFDTEFHEDKHGIELISIGMISEDGREYYAVNKEYDQNRANPWLKKHVVAQIEPSNYSGSIYKSLSVIKTDIEKFCNDMDEVWGWCSAHDWFLLNRLMGGMLHKPVHWPWCCFDLEQARAMKGLQPSVFPPYHSRPDVHNALADARWTREAYFAIMKPLQSEH
jgi:3' exoribonuclease, RNase T-like